MSVVITFEPAGLTAVVAKRTYLHDAARRMGVPLALQCDREGKFHGCVVIVRKGEALLSAPTEAEFQALGSELMQSRRMACQAFAEKDGELILEIASYNNSMNNDPTKDVRKEFASLPLAKKLTTLMQLEVATVMEALDEISHRSTSLAGKLFDKIEERSGKTKQKQNAREPHK